MKKATIQITLMFGIVSLLTTCKENEPTELISGQVICRGGCWPTAYYVNINGAKLKGKTQTVTDDNGRSRGPYTNVLIINNLKISDQQEGKDIFFKNYKDTEVSCQSSYPRAVREIDIAY